MDILSPDLLWIEGRCYRLPSLDFENNRDKPDEMGNDIWLENELECDSASCTTEGDNSETYLMIENVSENRFKLQFPVAQTFWPQIIGSKGVTKKRIETDTETKIIVPRPMENGNIEIKGSSKKNIILAKKCIDAIVSSARQKLNFTHFISIPTNSDEIKTNFIKFKEEVIRSFGNDRGVSESIFQNPDKLHLTIATLVLVDQSERNIAEGKLNEVFNDTIKPALKNIGSQLKIEVRGIEYMNDDPSEVDVLYGKIHAEPDKNILQDLANRILDHFTQDNLIKPDSRQNVKLHITLMNTLFREEELEEINEEIVGLNKNKRGKKNRITFNAVNILERFHNFYFGQQELKTIELSVRYSTSKSGYYKNSCLINLQDFGEKL